MKTKISKTEELIKKKIEALGSTKTATWLIECFIKKETDNAFSLNMLPDSSTLANGIEAIEECFDDQDFGGATNIAMDTAVEMLEDEGYEFN